MSIAQIPQVLRSRLVFVTSVLAFCIRAIQYALIGAYAPLLFVMTAIIAFLLATLFGESILKRLIKVWAVFLIAYGGIRLLLGVMVRFDLIPSAHAIDAVTVFFVVSSILFIAAGVYLLRRPIAGNN